MKTPTITPTKPKRFPFVTAIMVTMLGISVGQEPDEEPTLRSLKDAVGDRFKLGVGVSHRVVRNADDSALIKQHFGILTPENCMKPQGIHPAEERWEFEATDRFVAFAKENNLEVVGHCLVWAKDDRTDEWMMKEGDGDVSRETLLKRITSHIDTVVSRYAETATMWDVVNEALSDSGSEELLRDSVYSRVTGMDFIVTAFKAARANDPDALLIYNDYNGHKPGKREKLIQLLTELKRRGATVDAYGMQGHFELGDDSLPQLRETFDALRGLGVKVVVSELDIDVVTRGKWWADDGAHREELRSYDPYANGMPAEVEQRLTAQYVEIFELFHEYRDIIERVSFWNLHDGQSWLNYFPWRRVNHPLLFDRDRQPKPSFDGVYEFLRAGDEGQALAPDGVPDHPAWERTDENSRKAHEQLLAKVKRGRIDVYFQGDSIMRRWGATDYPQLLEHWKASFHGWNAANFAWGGDATQNILWRMRNGELDGVQPKLIVLQAGTNNLPWRGKANPGKVDEVCEGLQAIIGEFRRKVAELDIVLTGLFPRPQNPDLAPTIAAINTRLRALAASDAHISFIDISSELAGEDGAFLPGMSKDGLHLEKAGYEVWARALKPVIHELLGEPGEADFAPPATGNPAARR